MSCPAIVFDVVGLTLCSIHMHNFLISAKLCGVFQIHHSETAPKKKPFTVVASTYLQVKKKVVQVVCCAGCVLCTYNVNKNTVLIVVVTACMLK